MRLNYRTNFLLTWLAEILYFPLWWYSFGLLRVLKFSWKFIVQREARIGFWVWLSNIFVPMYGQRDLAGRFASLVVRGFQVVFRGIIMIFFCLIALAFIILWIILPIIVINGIYNNLHANQV